MSIKRFVAANARDAMAQVKRELGADALVLSNRTLTGGRVELLAAAPDDMASLVEDVRPNRKPAREGTARSADNAVESAGAAKAPKVESFHDFLRRQQETKAAPRPAQRSATANMYQAIAASIDPPARAEANEVFAPTVFRRRAAPLPAAQPQEQCAATVGAGEPATDGPVLQASVVGAAGSVAMQGPVRSVAASVSPAVATAAPVRSSADDAIVALVAQPAGEQVADSEAAGARPTGAKPTGVPLTAGHALARSVPAQAESAQPPAVQSIAMQPPAVQSIAMQPPAVQSIAMQPPAGADAELLVELQSMRALLLEQMATMNAASSAQELQKRNPAQVRVMTRLLTAGFSPQVARHIAAHVEADLVPAQIDAWLHDVLTLNIQCSAPADSIVERGGIYALVGPTGVGKTTTVAKLAARFAVKHGAAQLALITLDAYRVGAHEQLRTYGRILGAPVHLAQEGATLHELIASMSSKRLVLIDTCGVSQRDDRLQEMLAMLECAGTAQRPVQRVLLLNAASHAETLDAVAVAWRARESGGAILTKLDEATRIGGAIDVTLRHKLVLLGATNGQRVPEDWLEAASPVLAANTLQPGAVAFALDDAQAALVVTQAAPAAPSPVAATMPPPLSRAIVQRSARVAAPVR